MVWGALVVGTVMLAAVTPENPAIEVDGVVGLPLDGVTRNATRGINHPLAIQNRLRRAVVDAGATRAAAIGGKRLVVAIGLGGQHQLSQMNKTTVPRGDEE